MFEPGNQLAKDRQSPKPFRDMLLLAIQEAKGDKTRLRKVAEKLVDVAIKGNVAAIKEVADRIDGKVPQALVADEDGGPLVLQVVRYVIDPAQVIDVTPQLELEADVTVTGEAVIEPTAPCIEHEKA